MASPEEDKEMLRDVGKAIREQVKQWNYSLPEKKGPFVFFQGKSLDGFNSDAARTYAAKHDGCTIHDLRADGTPVSEKLAAMKKGLSPREQSYLDQWFVEWAYTSGQFARMAHGDVVAFRNDKVKFNDPNRPDPRYATFDQVECRFLLGNERVRSINGIPKEELAKVWNQPGTAAEVKARRDQILKRIEQSVPKDGVSKEPGRNNSRGDGAPPVRGRGDDPPPPPPPGGGLPMVRPPKPTSDPAKPGPVRAPDQTRQPTQPTQNWNGKKQPLSGKTPARAVNRSPKIRPAAKRRAPDPGSAPRRSARRRVVQATGNTAAKKKVPQAAGAKRRVAPTVKRSPAARRAKNPAVAPKVRPAPGRSVRARRPTAQRPAAERQFASRPPRDARPSGPRAAYPAKWRERVPARKEATRPNPAPRSRRPRAPNLGSTRPLPPGKFPGRRRSGGARNLRQNPRPPPNQPHRSASPPPRNPRSQPSNRPWPGSR